MKYKIIIGLSAILYFTGCYNREQTPRLSEAEKLMQNNPDSALAILQKLKPEGNRAEQARYALLYSEALEKKQMKVTDDSLIRQAWQYYKHYPKIYVTSVKLYIIGEELNYAQVINREHYVFFSK